MGDFECRAVGAGAFHCFDEKGQLVMTVAPAGPQGSEALKEAAKSLEQILSGTKELAAVTKKPN